jgi:protein SCO1
LRRAAFALLGAAMLLLCGCRRNESHTYVVTGFVQWVAAAQKQVTISHDEIPGFMPAMTMSFDVASEKLLDGVAPGARVEFRLLRSDTELRIDSLRVLTPAPAVTAPGRLPLDPGALAPDFALTDQDGRPVELSRLRGRPVLLDFIFTRCPGPCPIVTSRMVDVRKKLAPALEIATQSLSITLDPAWDTPERLREYAGLRGAVSSHWSFLSGDPAAIQTVLDAYRIGTVRQPDGSIDHVVATFLIDRDGRIAHRYLGLETRAAEIAEDVAKLGSAGLARE